MTRLPVPVRPLGAALTLALGLTGCGDGSADAPADASERPDLILISLDTLRRDHCSFYGYERDTTPFLAELAEDSLVFDNARAVSTWTLISHMSMLTGLYPDQHGVYEATAALSEEVPTLAQVFDSAGARTSGVHFPGWLDPRFGFDRGFNAGYRSAVNAEEAGEILADRMPWGPEQWAFTFIHLFDIHSDDTRREGSKIYDNPPPYDTMFAPDAEELLDGIDPTYAWDEDATDFTPEMVEAVVGLYDGGIRYVDDELRTWFTDWRERGLLDNAIVIVTSDHGEGLRRRTDRFGGHGDLFEEGLRVPLLVHFTPQARQWVEDAHGIDASTLVGRRDDNVSHVDLLPTVLELYDLPVRVVYPGESLLTPTTEDRLIHAQRHPTHFITYEGDIKVHCDPEGRVLQFADLEGDFMGIDQGRPEREDIARAKELALRARQDIRSMESYLPGGAGELDEAQKDALRGLGYADQVDDDK